MRVLALVTDAFGGFGGIAQYNCDFLSALAAAESVSQVLVLPRLGDAASIDLPVRLRQLPPIASRWQYACQSFRLAANHGPLDLVFCGHILMAPLGVALARYCGVPMWAQVHGIDAWSPQQPIVSLAMHRADLITSVSRYTRSQMLSRWLSLEPWRLRVLPNTVREQFTPGVAPAYLKARYELDHRKVLLTISRVSKEDAYKGHDHVIRALPAVIRQHSDVAYVVAGEGDGLPRLQALVDELSLHDHVKFIGRVAADELADHYRLADAFVMPSINEGFGIVFLEAAACGTPVIGGNRDGSWDALKEGRVGRAIDPENEAELVNTIIETLVRGRNVDACELSVFARSNFTRQVDTLASEIAGSRTRAGSTWSLLNPFSLV